MFHVLCFWGESVVVNKSSCVILFLSYSQLFSGMESVRTGVRMVGTANPDDITSTTESIPAYISKMSVLVKPVIYAITDPKFRKELMEGFFPLRWEESTSEKLKQYLEITPYKKLKNNLSCRNYNLVFLPFWSTPSWLIKSVNVADWKMLLISLALCAIIIFPAFSDLCRYSSRKLSTGVPQHLSSAVYQMTFNMLHQYCLR